MDEHPTLPHAASPSVPLSVAAGPVPVGLVAVGSMRLTTRWTEELFLATGHITDIP
ncbi:MAG: hypothetical protein QOF35_1122, partial [Actinomycetota bacterium]|nr:hypothetical protein [Actinomycetota bacterium]